MENKSSLIIVLLVILIGVVSGVGLLTGVNNAVRASLSPIYAKLAEIDRTEKSIENKLNAGGNGNSNASLIAIQNELSQIKNKINANVEQPQMPPPEDMNKVYTIPSGTSAIIGKKDAPVTIVEFSDFQCPFCARFYSVIKDVMAAYPDKVRVIIKHFPLPFHSNARPAAKLAMAANEQGKFQGMMESLLASGGDVTEPKIKEYSKKLGLDYNKLIADYKNQDARWEKQIQDDMQLGAGVDVRGTPTFYLNGRKTNARDLNSFKAQIDVILAGKK
jgi:protein-disulfide isomerase